MHTYIDLYFTGDGVSPIEVADRLRTHAGLTFVTGTHDMVFEWTTVEEFRTMLQKIHESLKGTGVTYHVETGTEDPTYVPPSAWPPALSDSPPRHPGYRDPK